MRETTKSIYELKFSKETNLVRKKKTEISVDGATKEKNSDQNLTKTEQIKLIEI